MNSASDLETSANKCDCDNCMKLHCLFQNVTGLQSLMEQFKLAFSDDLQSVIHTEINAFLNSDWSWQDDLTGCEGVEKAVNIKDELKDVNDEGLAFESANFAITENQDEDIEDDQVASPKIVIKSASALFEVDEEEDAEEIDTVDGSKETVYDPKEPDHLPEPGPSRRQSLPRYNLARQNGKKWIQCPVCDLSFKSVESLETHMESHPLTHECSECHMAFYNLEQASKHICPVLNGEQMDDSNDEEESVGGANGEQTYMNMDAKPDADPDEIVIDDDEDSAENNEEDLLKCAHCDTYFISKDEMEEHEENAHLGTIKDQLTGVIYKMPVDDSYCCGLCGKTCKNLFSFNTHLRSRHKTNPLKPPDNTCEVCGKAYDTLTRLRRHMSYQHGSRNAEVVVKKPGHPCDVCGKTFPSSYRLKHHYRTHTGERPCECEFCGKRFRNTSHLNDHRRIHTGERPYKCLHCGNSYIQGSQLKAHLRSRHGFGT